MRNVIANLYSGSVNGNEHKLKRTECEIRVLHPLSVLPDKTSVDRQQAAKFLFWELNQMEIQVQAVTRGTTNIQTSGRWQKRMTLTM